MLTRIITGIVVAFISISYTTQPQAQYGGSDGILDARIFNGQSINDLISEQSGGGASTFELGGGRTITDVLNSGAFRYDGPRP